MRKYRNSTIGKTNASREFRRVLYSPSAATLITQLELMRMASMLVTWRLQFLNKSQLSNSFIHLSHEVKSLLLTFPMGNAATETSGHDNYMLLSPIIEFTEISNNYFQHIQSSKIATYVHA